MSVLSIESIGIAYSVNLTISSIIFLNKTTSPIDKAIGEINFSYELSSLRLKKISDIIYYNSTLPFYL